MALLSYRRHRFPPPIIQHAIWIYLRFTLSYRDVEELLAERGLEVSYETVRRWVLKFGATVAQRDGARARVTDGILMRWLCGSRVGGCISGAPSITRARSWTCWCSDGAINAPR